MPTEKKAKKAKKKTEETPKPSWERELLLDIFHGLRPENIIIEADPKRSRTQITNVLQQAVADHASGPIPGWEGKLIWECYHILRPDAKKEVMMAGEKLYKKIAGNLLTSVAYQHVRDDSEVKRQDNEIQDLKNNERNAKQLLGDTLRIVAKRAGDSAIFRPLGELCIRVAQELEMSQETVRALQLHVVTLTRR